jgi:hypothetical protein
MKPSLVKALDRKRFNALAGLSRSPAAAYVSEELGWYSNEDETVIGVALHDIIDDDFAAVVLARDQGGRFRAFDVQSSIETEEEARSWLERAIKWHTGAGVKVYPQGATRKELDLFTPVLPTERLHPYFVHLSNDSAFIPAREIIRRITPHYIDVDGNFVEQFQSTGFDARLWELYLYAYIAEEELFLDRTHSAPDFLVAKYDKTVAIEAVIVGRKEDNPPKYFKVPPKPKAPSEILEAQEHVIPIKFGSPLYSKLNKKYWEFPHVAGKPLVFAIADFHDDQSMLWTSTALINYLYGVRHEFYYDGGQLVISPVKLDTHKVGEKEVPSGYFFQPEAEHVSAILFSASGTVSKFNRIGRQAGFYDPQLVMIRVGTCHDHDPNAAVPKLFSYKIDETCNESWAEGLSMFHNPNALHPVPEELFPRIAHHHFREGRIVSYLPEFYPYASVTHNVHIRGVKSG